MDALNFLEERKRMCKTSYDREVECTYCPAVEKRKCLVGLNGDDFFWEVDSWEKAIEIVEKWSKENPKKTRKSEFLKNYPNARLNSNGNPTFCVKTLGYNEVCEVYSKCADCWNKEVK